MNKLTTGLKEMISMISRPRLLLHFNITFRNNNCHIILFLRHSRKQSSSISETYFVRIQNKTNLLHIRYTLIPRIDLWYWSLKRYGKQKVLWNGKFGLIFEYVHHVESIIKLVLNNPPQKKNSKTNLRSCHLC